MKLIVIPEVRTNPQTRTLETRWNAFWVRSRFLLLLRWDFLPSVGDFLRYLADAADETDKANAEQNASTQEDGQPASA